MDEKEKVTKEKPKNGAAIQGNIQNQSDDIPDEKLAEDDLENATDRLNAKVKQQWQDYEKSLAPPQQDPPTEEPLRRSMEDLTLQNGNNPGTSTDKESTMIIKKLIESVGPKLRKEVNGQIILEELNLVHPKKKRRGGSWTHQGL